MNIFSPTFEFRENRGYVHTTDMYDVIVEGVPRLGLGLASGPLRLNIRRMTHCQLNVCFSDSGPAQVIDEKAPINFIVGVDGAPLWGWLAETERPVTGIRAYDESSMEEMSRVDGTTIRLTEETGFTPIEVLTCLTRRLHESLVAITEEEKWVDVRVDLDRLFRPEDAAWMQVTMVKNFDRKWTKSLIGARDGTIGAIYFSLVRR